MQILLFSLSVAAFLYGFMLLGAAKSAIHEIEGFVVFVISAVLFTGAGMIDAINKVSEKFELKTRRNSGANDAANNVMRTKEGFKKDNNENAMGAGNSDYSISPSDSSKLVKLAITLAVMILLLVIVSHN